MEMAMCPYRRPLAMRQCKLNICGLGEGLPNVEYILRRPATGDLLLSRCEAINGL